MYVASYRIEFTCFKTYLETQQWIQKCAFHRDMIELEWNWINGEIIPPVMGLVEFPPWNSESLIIPECKDLVASNWITKVKLVLYILKHNPPTPNLFFSFLRRANFHHKDTRTVNIDPLDRWWPSRNRSLKHLLVPARPPHCQAIMPSGLMCYRLQIANI